ncbi:uncharacterized protein BYT42DRAFT_611176 [Radiomyces spectabilis]|uniref:uncharacterized protein n=1 Tax=Radiomyces spectabilis TaxID=64574 RepID=UPI0022208BAE|nr:uncharacterized protein BYT42DRAFT_611176 [Radiomyces spectabilis]KAI8388101.1 hypothetical protein BYT42DRAFT_611176 [Radiomyces spectabilis]
MATVEEFITLQHNTYKNLKACLEPEEKARTVLQEFEAKLAGHNETVEILQRGVSRLKKASKREYQQMQNLENDGLFKSMFHSHKVKLEEQRGRYRKAFQAEQDAIIELENMQAEKEKLRTQALAAKEEHQRYKVQHLQLNRFIENVFQEATNVENYPELIALAEKIEQKNQAKSRCHTEHLQAEMKKSDISSAIQSLEKASKVLALGIDAPTFGDMFSSRGDHKISVNSAKQHVERAIRLLQAQRVSEAYIVKTLLDSMVLRKDNSSDKQHECNQKRRVQLELWEAQLRGIQKGMLINLLVPLNKKINDFQRETRNHGQTIMTLKNNMLQKQQQILDNILSDIPDYQLTGAPPPYMSEPTASAS